MSDNMDNKVNNKIGVFDSGFGGLEILREITNKLPEYSYLYLADTARAPYGNRSQDLIYHFTKQAVDYLFKQGCLLIILACNTASSEALRKIQQEYIPRYYSDKKVLGVVVPAIEEAVSITKNNRIGVMATSGTVSSGAFTKELQKINKDIKVFEKDCPLLVPIVEAGEHQSEIADKAIANYLEPLLEQNIDTLILGCTHYGLLKYKIERFIISKDKEVGIISEGEVVAKKLKDYLNRHREIENKLAQDSQVEFLTTDLTEQFKSLASQFFNKQIFPKKVIIDQC